MPIGPPPTRSAAALSSANALKGPFSTIDADKDLTQKELFSLLARLSPTEAALFLNSHASALKRLAHGNPGNADDIAKLWLSLGAGAKAVAKDNPDIVGNLEGASSWDRGVANNIVLDREITAAEYGLEHGGNRAPDYYRYRLDALQNIKFAVGAGLDSKPPYTIHSLDTGDTVLASVVLGDLDNADCASYNVPGMDTTVHDSMTNWTTASKGFYDEQASLLVAGGMAAVNANAQVAVVSWIGYDTPNKLTVSSAYEAFIGAQKLDDSINGTNAQRHLHTPDGRLGVIAHSYGSSTAMIALSKATHADTLVTYGSAGEVIGSHPILNDGWYQTQAPDDHIATLGQVLGDRPSPLIDQSSQPLDSQSGHWANPSTGKLEYVTSSHDHSGYLVKNTASLHNMAAVTIGRTDLLSVPEGPNPQPNIAPTPPK